MMSLRAKKTAKKKEEILKSAISVIGEKGYHATTMEDIAAKLLMTKGSVYYYFKDKQDLLYQSYKMLLERSLKNITEIREEDIDPEAKLLKIMSSHIDYIVTERSGFEVGMKPEHFFEGSQLEIIMDLRSRYAKSLDEVIIEGINEGYFHNVDVKIARNIILGAMNWVIQWYKTEGEKSKEELSEAIAHYLMKVLKNND
ncbi:TetR/AcrR family transcriptional regulator [Aliibacillus thermotolerans]|uniref:TetR/AcrR family transcriptional regulator n=2 Tax=Aliibacillus thermotolerans TaxID=1834418 RepID=A0ABW0U4F8_9BACI|nr:TetR/AcrR family transcriptional regulator [Aliibacillus thermotolerans]